MTDLTEQMAAASELQAQNLNDEVLSKLEEAVERQKTLTAQKQGLEDEAKVVGEQLKAVSMTEIPELMASVGLSKIVTKSGASLEIKPYYSVSFPKEEPQITEALTWLKESGNGGVIKVGVQIFLDPKSDEIPFLRVLFTKFGVPADFKETVHPMTLKSFVKELVESGKPIPLELFNAFIGQIAVIKEEKKKDGKVTG